MRPRTVLSLEQALSLPSATLRFVQLGWRVIRIESTPSCSSRVLRARAATLRRPTRC